MTVITLSDEQSRLLGEASSPIVLVDSCGRELGTVSPTPKLGPDATEEEVIAEIHRRMANDTGERRLFSDLLKELHERFPE
jgi:hypothetical protein